MSINRLNWRFTPKNYCQKVLQMVIRRRCRQKCSSFLYFLYVFILYYSKCFGFEWENMYVNCLNVHLLRKQREKGKGKRQKETKKKKTATFANKHFVEPYARFSTMFERCNENVLRIVSSRKKENEMAKDTRT